MENIQKNQRTEQPSCTCTEAKPLPPNWETSTKTGCSFPVVKQLWSQNMWYFMVFWCYSDLSLVCSLVLSSLFKIPFFCTLRQDMSGQWRTFTRVLFSWAVHTDTGDPRPLGSTSFSCRCSCVIMVLTWPVFLKMRSKDTGLGVLLLTI